MQSSKWYPNKAKNKIYIRKYEIVDGKMKWEYYDKLYDSSSLENVQLLLNKLNYSYEKKKMAAQHRFEYKHKYVNETTIEAYRSFLKTKANQREHIEKLIAMLNQYTFEYFIEIVEEPTPAFWKKHEDGFGQYLLEQKISTDYLSRIVQNTNRFINFLHNKFLSEVSLSKLNCVSKAVLDKNQALNKSTRKKYISEENYKIIIETIDSAILNHVILSYSFGLRRSEV
jgi:hypothetical protein